MKRILVAVDFPLNNISSGNKVYVYWMLRKLFEEGHIISVVARTAELKREERLDPRFVNLIVDYDLRNRRIAFLKRYLVTKLIIRRRKNFPTWLWTVNWNIASKTKRFDRIIVNYPWNYKVVKGFHGEKTLWAHDSFLNRNLALDLKWVSISLLGLNRCYKYFDKVIHSNYFEYMNESRYFDNIYYQRLPLNIDKIEKRIVNKNCINFGFIGSVNDVNVRTLKLIISNWSRIANKDDCLVVAGAIAEYAVKLEISLRIIPLGYLEDINHFYSRVDVVFSTVGKSTGIKIKEIEALSKGVRIIADRWTRASYEQSLDLTTSIIPFEDLTRIKLLNFLVQEYEPINYFKNM